MESVRNLIDKEKYLLKALVHIFAACFLEKKIKIVVFNLRLVNILIKEKVNLFL